MVICADGEPKEHLFLRLDSEPALEEEQFSNLFHERILQSNH